MAKKKFTFDKMVEDYEKSGGKVTDINPTPELIDMLEKASKEKNLPSFEEMVEEFIKEGKKVTEVSATSKLAKISEEVIKDHYAGKTEKIVDND